MKKFIFLILFSSFLHSLLTANYFINKFDRSFYDNKTKNYLNGIIGNSDVYRHLNNSDVIINALTQDDGELQNNQFIYWDSFLHPRLISVYRIIINHKYQSYNFDINTNSSSLSSKLMKLNSKLYFFIFQKIIYLSSIFYLYIILNRIFSEKKTINNEEKYIPILSLIYLAFEPTINQYHNSFYSESIYFTIMVLIFSFTLKLYNNKKPQISTVFIIGILCSISFMQRTVSLFIIIIIYFFLISLFKKEKIKIFIVLLFSSSIIYSIILFDNFKRTNQMFLLPMQTKYDITFYYLIPNFYQKKLGISYEDSLRIFLEKYNLIIDNIEILNEVQKREIFSKLSSYAYKEIISSPYENSKIFFNNFFKTISINPFFIHNSYLFNANYENSDSYDPSKNHEKQKKFRLIYCSILYLFFLIGLYTKSKFINYKVKIFIFFIFSYFVFFSNLIYPNNRYLTPSLIFISVFVSAGINYIFNKHNLFFKKFFY